MSFQTRLVELSELVDLFMIYENIRIRPILSFNEAIGMQRLPEQREGH